MPDNRKPKFFYGYVVVALAFLIMTSVCGAFYSFGVFFKPVLTEFGWTRTILSGAYSLALILAGMLSVVAGRLNDRFGPRIIMTVCGFSFGLGYLLMSQMSAIWQLYLFYGVMVAAGLAGSWVPLVSTVARWFIKGRGLITGIVVSGIGFGTIIIPPLAERLITAYGWRNSYIILGTTLLVLITSTAQFLRRDPSQLGLAPYGVSELNGEELGPEARRPSLQQVLHSRQLWMLFALFICTGFGIQSIIVHIVPHATDLGISTVIAASILATFGGSSIVGRVILGSASDKIGTKPALVIGVIIWLLALSWLQLAEEVWMFHLFAAASGFAYGGFMALMSLAPAEAFGTGSHGTAFGIITLGSTIGESIGPLTAGRIFDVTGSYQLAFLICLVLATIGLMLTLLFRPTSNMGEGS